MECGILHSSYLDMTPYAECFAAQQNKLKVFLSHEVHDPLSITFALLWFPEDDFFERYPNIKVVASVAAGVDSILACPSLPEHVKVCRNRDDQQAAIMSTFAIWHVLNHQRNFPLYREQQANKVWQRQPMRAPSEVSVGVLGMGFMGERIAKDLDHLGFSVAGWRKTNKPLKDSNISVFCGSEELSAFLSRTEVLICVLPLTDETHGILNLKTFQKLKPNGYLVHLGRGGHLVESDLIQALQMGLISGASLDVFAQEPLPITSSLWEHPNLIITPHDASDVRPIAAVKNITNEYLRYIDGQRLQNEVPRSTGY